MKLTSGWRLVQLVFVFFLLPGMAFAQDHYNVGIQANQSAIEVMGEMGFDLPPSTLTFGGNFLYDEDEYDLYGLHARVGNIIAANALSGKLGFKAVAGEVEGGRADSDVWALAFSAGAEYDLSKAIASHYVPVTLRATLNLGPKPMSFDDTDEYVEFIAGLDWKVLENGAVMLNYRYLEIDFDDPVNWQKTDNAGYVGFKFMF
ncbi:MAG: YfaZ family outer membrane protein [Thermodesulfobacteriota bacterium]